jgi:cation diffusion facilitator CzcD-associated flavoprotein CzcO
MHLKSKDQGVSRDLVAGIMKEQLNDDARLTKHLVPEFALGCRRMTPGSGYLQSLTKSNVEVITNEAVRVTEDGIVDGSGTEHKVDVIVCATGFDTSFTPHFECIGKDSRSLKEQFGDFPKGYLGIMAENFPNLFRKSTYFAA